MNKCTKGLHEMTEDNTRIDRKGRKNCRKCAQDRKRRSRQGVKQHVAHHKAATLFNKERTAWDEALDRQPPVIEWRKTRGGIWVAVEIHDPHAETTIQAQADRLRASATRAEQLMAIEAYEVAERFRKHRADNTPLLAAARTEI